MDHFANIYGGEHPSTDPLDITSEIRKNQKQSFSTNESSNALELLIKQERCESDDDTENQYEDVNNDAVTTCGVANYNVEGTSSNQVPNAANFYKTSQDPQITPLTIGKLEEIIEANKIQTMKLIQAVRLLQKQITVLNDKLFPPQPSTSKQVVRHKGSEHEPFNYPKVSCKEELEALEKHLSTDDNHQKMIEMLNQQIDTMNYKQRLHNALFLLFTRKFLIECSWSGCGKPVRKIPFSHYHNILRLFKVIGENGYNIISNSTLRIFFQCKLNNASKSTMFTGSRKSICRVKMQNTSS